MPRKTKVNNKSIPTQKSKTVVMQSQYSGPLPAPIDLENYERISTGFADRIITMAEKEMQHRHDIENKAIEYSRTDVARGQWFAFIIIITVMICGLFLILNNKEVAGLASIITALGVLVSALLYNRNETRKEK